MKTVFFRQGTGVGKCPNGVGDFGHQLRIFVGDYIPNSGVVSNLDMYNLVI